MSASVDFRSVQRPARAAVSAMSKPPGLPTPKCAANSDLSDVTRAVRAGIECDDDSGCVVPPLHLTSTFAFRGFGEKRTYDYTRSGNPTRDLLGQALAELEQGAGAVVTASGMAAVTVCGYLVPAGARIVAPHDCYGGTYRLFDAWRRRGERQVEFVDFGDAAALRAALSQPAALLWIETPSNPLLRITDIAACAALGARRRRARRGRQHLPLARPGSSRSPSGRTSWCTRPPSTSTATATWSAGR